MSSVSQNIVNVPINFSQDGDFIKWRIPKQITLGSNPIEVLVHTDDDSA